ncbi:hypothetical protein Tco_1013772 [Tanacetum coccineum]
MLVREAEAMNRAKNGAGNESIKTSENDKAVEASGSQPAAYYLKHKINEKLIKGLVKNNRFNNSLLGTRVGKKKGKAYKVLLAGPVYDEILKKRTKKKDIGGNFKIPCSIGDLKHMNALVDQGFDVSFHRISDSSCITDKGVKNDIEPIAPIMTVNRLVIEWEERIKLHLEKEMKFNQW